jgi:hypothetical protein
MVKKSYGNTPSFTKKTYSKSGNRVVTTGFSKKGESKIVKDVTYMTRNTKFGKAKTKTLRITTIKKLGRL